MELGVLRYLLFILTTLYRQTHTVCIGFTMHFVFQAYTSPISPAVPLWPGILPELDCDT